MSIIEIHTAQAAWRHLAANLASDAVEEGHVEGTLASIETLQALVAGNHQIEILDEVRPGDVVLTDDGLVAVLAVHGEEIVISDHGIHPLRTPRPWRGVRHAAILEDGAR